jgi:hypothetical protein
MFLAVESIGRTIVYVNNEIACALLRLEIYISLTHPVVLLILPCVKKVPVKAEVQWVKKF